MCGIIGMVDSKEVQTELVDILKRLEYRGYDSSGIAVVNGALRMARAEGRITHLEKKLENMPLPGNIGIAHTRWATHGKPNEDNAHPHHYNGVAVVHNGIIENHASLRDTLEAQGHHFSSQTDTEVLPHLIASAMDNGCSALEAVQQTLPMLEGSFAIAVVFDALPDYMIGACRHSPLVLGKKDNQVLLSSDAGVIADKSDEMCFMEDDEMIVLTQNEVVHYDEHGKVRSSDWHKVSESLHVPPLQEGATFTQQEIAQQPATIRHILDNTPVTEYADMVKHASRLYIIGCGSSYYAALIAKYCFEQYAHIPVELHIASEFRYYMPPLEGNAMALCISQSGETADTLAAMDAVQNAGIPTIALTNAEHSQMARRSDHVWQLQAGKEIGVAATKSFTAQVTMMARIALACAEFSNAISPDRISDMLALPDLIAQTLACEPSIIEHAQALADKDSMIWLGRGPAFGAAQEAALKVKELTYMQAESYAAGELKHGPIALIDDEMPVWICAPSASPQYDKILANTHEVAARGAKSVIVTNESASRPDIDNAVWLTIPDAPEFESAILMVVVSQLLATHIAHAKGLNVDMPRNLAKSVTVE